MTLTILKKNSPKKKAKKPKLSPTEKAFKQQQKNLHTKVMNTFKNMQFEYIHSDGLHKTFDGQKGELDNIFVYENILLLVEETLSNDKDHIRKKYIYFDKIKNDLTKFITWLQTSFASTLQKFDDYLPNKYKIFYLYVSDSSIELETREAFPSLFFIDSTTLEHFRFLSGCIKYTARNELYKFLRLESADIGHSNSSSTGREIETAILIPETGSGFPNGVQVLTFVMQADDLMECSFVLRKGSWDQTMGLYQRLLDKKRIDSIREFLVKKQRTFIDSVIVSLPDDVVFSTKDPITQSKSQIDIFNNTEFANITITIPFKFNSIGIIDGQHRIFSHYKGNDVHESKISRLRNKRHLFVTGLFFDKNKYNNLTRRLFESELFLQINNEQKRVRPALLQYIEALNNPYSAIGIANEVLEYLNKIKPFLGILDSSPLAKGGIKTPTIIRYGLQQLVSIDNEDINLHTFWLKNGNEPANKISDIKDYHSYCAREIAKFFSAVKALNNPGWNEKKIKDSKILSVTSIVAYLRAYKRSLEIYNGPQDFEFYRAKLAPLNVDYKDYKSSHWNDLADEIEKQCWK